MSRFAGTLALALLVPALRLPAQQPATRAAQIRQQRAETQKSPLAPDTDKIEDAVVWANEHGLLTLFSRGWHGVTPTIGGMINGSGIGLGAQFLRADLYEGKFVIRSSARFSFSQYQLYDFEVGLPRNRAHGRGHSGLEGRRGVGLVRLPRREGHRLRR